MKSPLVKIKELLTHLPEKDIPWGDRFLTEHKIDDLKELVDSAFYLTKKNQSKEVVPDKYKNVSLENLRDLKMEVDNYHSLLSNILGEDDYDSEIDTELFEQELDTI